MSLAEWYMENSYQISKSANARRLQACLDSTPSPLDDLGWTALCRDSQWKYKVPESENDVPILYYCQTLASPDPQDYWGKKCPTQAVPVPTTASASGEPMHRGALAPSWVFETSPANKEEEEEEGKDTLESYQRRLIAAVTGRFVLIERSDAHGSETLVSSCGRPQPGVRYRWRYWDNAGNVYDDLGEKYCFEFSAVQTFHNQGVLPGDFRGGLKTWMRIGTQQGFDPFALNTFTEDVCLNPGESQRTLLSSFWDCLWSWKYEGSTGCLEWDARLDLLAETAGVEPSLKYSSMWPLEESELDTLAASKGWKKLEAHQPAMASYRKEDARLNFYLSTGTVGSALHHPSKGKTQLFRRNVQDAKDAAIFFDNPRTHTGKGYFTKQQQDEEATGSRKCEAMDPPMERTCQQCGEQKSMDEFSKNQRRKGAAARCRACIDRP